MDDKEESDAVTMIKFEATLIIFDRSPLDEDSQKRETRKHLIFLLIAYLAFPIFDFCMRSFLFYYKYDKFYIEQSGVSIAQVCLHAFGLFAVHRHSTRGLRIFAWLKIIQTILMYTILIILILMWFFAPQSLQLSNDGSIFGMYASLFSTNFSVLLKIFIVVSVVADLINAVQMIRCSFKLARLIDVNGYSAVDEV